MRPAGVVCLAAAVASVVAGYNGAGWLAWACAAIYTVVATDMLLNS